MLYNCEGKAKGPFCASYPIAGGPEKERGLGWVVAFQDPKNLRRDVSVVGCKRDFLNSEIHELLLEQGSLSLGSTGPSQTSPRAEVWLCWEHRSLPPSCGRRALCRSLRRRLPSSPQNCILRPLVEILYITRRHLWLSNRICFPISLVSGGTQNLSNAGKVFLRFIPLYYGLKF